MRISRRLFIRRSTKRVGHYTQPGVHSLKEKGESLIRLRYKSLFETMLSNSLQSYEVTVMGQPPLLLDLNRGMNNLCVSEMC